MIKKIINRLNGYFKPAPDAFFSDAIGVIHVGANVGQEREFYNNRNLPVLWVEPIPEIFEILKKNISAYKNQKALQYLLTDKDGETYEFNIANNNGASSSILELGKHKEMWPDVGFSKKISLKSITLESLILKEKIAIGCYDTLVMDTQGSELLVLKGAGKFVQNFKYIKTEVPDFESYQGCCQLADMNAFMISNGYKEYSRCCFAKNPKGGEYYDVVYINRLKKPAV